MSDEEMELPTGWTWTTLGETLPLIYGKGLVETARDSLGEVPVFGSSGQVGVHNQALTTRATLIVGRKGSVGAVHYSSVPCWPIDTTYFVEESPERELRFFLYLLQYLNLGKLDKSTAIPGLSRDDYNAVPIALAPLAEQRRIVAAIEELFTRLDSGVAALRRAQAALKRYLAAVLKAAVEGRLTADWRAAHPDAEPASALLGRILAERRVRWEAEQRAKGKDPAKARYDEPAAPATAALPAVPDGWVWATVEQLAAPEPNAITDGPFGSNLKTEHYQEEGMRVIRLQNIGDGIFRNEDTAFIAPEHFATLRRHQVLAGDLVIAALGENPPRSCVIPATIGPAIVKADCIRFHVSPEASAAFVNFALNSDPTKRRTAGLLHGVGRPRLNSVEIKSIMLPTPPLAEQEQIVAEIERRLSVVGEMEATVAVTLKRAERLRQAILERAFNGRLVAQDPADEPASTLLARIRAERAGTGHNGRNDHQWQNGASTAMPTAIVDDVPASEPIHAEQRGLWGDESGK